MLTRNPHSPLPQMFQVIFNKLDAEYHGLSVQMALKESSAKTQDRQSVNALRFQRNIVNYKKYVSLSALAHFFVRNDGEIDDEIFKAVLKEACKTGYQLHPTADSLDLLRKESHFDTDVNNAFTTHRGITQKIAYTQKMEGAEDAIAYKLSDKKYLLSVLSVLATGRAAEINPAPEIQNDFYALLAEALKHPDNFTQQDYERLSQWRPSSGSAIQQTL